MSESPSSNTAVCQRTAEAEMTWDDLNKEDDCAVTELNNKVISRLPEAGTFNQSLARKHLIECNTALAEIRALLIGFESETKGAQDLIEERETVQQESRIFRKLGEMSLVTSAVGTDEPAVWLGPERRAEVNNCLTANTDLLLKVNGGNDHIKTSKYWLKALEECTAILSKKLSIADAVGTLQEEDQAFIKESVDHSVQECIKARSKVKAYMWNQIRVQDPANLISPGVSKVKLETFEDSTFSQDGQK